MLSPIPESAHTHTHKCTHAYAYTHTVPCLTAASAAHEQWQLISKSVYKAAAMLATFGVKTFYLPVRERGRAKEYYFKSWCPKRPSIYFNSSEHKQQTEQQRNEAKKKQVSKKFLLLLVVHLVTHKLQPELPPVNENQQLLNSISVWNLTHTHRGTHHTLTSTARQPSRRKQQFFFLFICLK